MSGQERTPAPETRKDVRDEPPPFLGAWPRVYAAVLVFLGLLIAAFYLFGRSFTP